MFKRVAPAAVGVSVLVLSAAVAGSVAAQGGDGGSEVPCAAPLAWRVARVDAEFGISEEQARAAVRDAATRWEDALGAPLFEHDDEDGFPIRFVFDERQARTRERIARERELHRSGLALDSTANAFRIRVDARERAQDRYEERLADHLARAAEHNEDVRAWTGRGAAPVGVVRDLRATAAALEEERAGLDEVRDDLRAELAELRAEELRLGAQVDARNREIDAVTAQFPPTPVESGVYRESVRRVDGRLASVSREIRLYRFDDLEDLRTVAAHELGHALGLGHSATAGALMSQAYGGSTQGSVAIGSEEVTELRRLCAPEPEAADEITGRFSERVSGGRRPTESGRNPHGHVTILPGSAP